MFLSLTLLLACEETSSVYTLHCDLGEPTLQPATAPSGALVVATARALTTVSDTSVRVGASAATVTDVDRSACGDCDSCREKSGCTSCDDCDDCAADCAPCVESVTFTVPLLPEGPHGVTLTNIHGQSLPATLTVGPVLPDDSGDTGDTGDTGDSGA